MLFLFVQVAASESPTRSNEEESLLRLLSNIEQHHPQLKSLRAQLRGTREVINELNAAYRPSLFLESNIRSSQRDATLQTGSEFEQTIAPRELSLRLSQTVYNGGRKGLQRYGAELQIESADAEYAANSDQLKLDIISDYVALSAALVRIEVLEETNALLRDLLVASEERDRLGDGSAIETAQVQSRLSNSQAQLAQAKGERAIIKSRIESSSGVMLPSAKLPVLSIEPLNYELEDVQRRIRKSNPSLRASELQVKAARVQLMSEMRSGRPTIALNASAITSDNNSPTIDRDDQLTIGLRLTMPIYSGGQRQSAKRRSYANVKATELSSVEQARQLDLAILQIWQGLIVQEDTRLAQETNLSAALVAQDGVIASQKAGFASASDVLDAVQQVLSARLSLSQAEHDAAQSRLLLLFYLGELEGALVQRPNVSETIIED